MGTLMMTTTTPTNGAPTETDDTRYRDHYHCHSVENGYDPKTKVCMMIVAVEPSGRMMMVIMMADDDEDDD
jgi:hypothetical protein